jgi:hypothetical protein
LELARLNIHPSHQTTFTRLAAYWNEYAAICDRESHLWTDWCQSADVNWGSPLTVANAPAKEWPVKA